MDNYRSSGVHYQNQGTNTNNNNNNNNGGKNRNRKKKNKQNKNQNIPLSPSKNMINHYNEYGGSMSLDHQSFGRPYNKFANNNNQNYNYTNQNNRGKYNNGNFNKRRNASQSNYYSSGTYENDRLNKSLTPNSSFGENSKIQTSISLDNFDLVSSLNAKRSPTSSYPLMSSNVVIDQKQTSPYKCQTYQQQQQTIVEQANLEEMSETTTSLSLQETENKSNDVLSSITSTESLNTSGDFMVDHHTPLSNYSTPMNHSDSSRVFDPDMSPRKHREHEESLNQNDKTPVKCDESEHTVKHSEAKSDDSSAISSNSSPDSKNSDQNLVTASEGESSFTNEVSAPSHHEHNLAKELEKIAANFELIVDKNQETESNKSVNGSADSSATESFTTTSNERDEELKETESVEQNEASNEAINDTNNQETQLVIQEVRLDQLSDEDKKEETVIEMSKESVVAVEEKEEHVAEQVDVEAECVNEAGSDAVIEQEEKREEAVVLSEEKALEEKDGGLAEEKIEETVVQTDERAIEHIVEQKQEETAVEKELEEKNSVVDEKASQQIEEKSQSMQEENLTKVEGEQVVSAEAAQSNDAHSTEILIATSHEIKIRPHVEEINLTDGEQEIKHVTDLNIAPIETRDHEQTCSDEDHQEFEILDKANESVVTNLSDKSNTSITQKEPAVDCFSCTIV